MFPSNIYRKYWDSWESETIHFRPKHTYIVYYSFNKIFKGVFFNLGAPIPRYLPSFWGWHPPYAYVNVLSLNFIPNFTAISLFRAMAVFRVVRARVQCNIHSAISWSQLHWSCVTVKSNANVTVYRVSLSIADSR